MTTLGAVHLTFGIVALLAGLAAILMKKGTRWHRTIGHLYFTSMLALNVTALTIYRLFGTFGPFHALAIVSLVYILLGVGVVVLRRPRARWLAMHARFMLWSYAGLMAAAVSEVTARVPGWNFWLAVVIPSCLVIAIAWVMIHFKGAAAIARLSRQRQTSAEGA